jgi:hypothetical protein
MCIIVLTSDLMEAARGQNHQSEAENGMKELLNNHKNPLTGPIRFELWPQLRKIGPSDLQAS